MYQAFDQRIGARLLIVKDRSRSGDNAMYLPTRFRSAAERDRGGEARAAHPDVM